MEILDFKNGPVGLFARLQGIAAVGVQERLVHEDDRRAGRAGEARYPGQALIGVGQVFVLVLVLVRHDETVKAHPLHLGPEQRHMGHAL